MSHHPNRLHSEDQDKVDQYLKQGVNATERKPFRPLTLMGWLLASILILGLLSRQLGTWILT